MHKFVQWIPMLAATVLLSLAGVGCSAKVKASYHLERAERYYQAGQYQQAEIEYKNVLRNAPENAEAWSRLGIIYCDQGRPLEALPILAKAAQLDTNNIEVRLKLASAYLGVGNFKAARQEASLVFERRPQDPQAPVLLAKASVTTNQIAETRRQLQSAYKNGETAPLDVALGMLAIRQHDVKTAETFFKLALSRDPKSGEAYSALANLEVLKQNFKGAAPLFQKAAQLAPVWSGNGVAYARFKILTGDDAAGKQMLQAIVKQSPYYLPAWLALADLATAQTNYDQGLKLVENVLSRDPQNFDGLLLKGRLELLQGRTDRAIKNLEATAKMFPKAPSVYFQLALAQLAARQTDQAVNNLNQALSLNPQFAQATLLLAQIQIRQGNVAVAIPALKGLLAKQPRLLPAQLLLADAYRVQGTPADAIRLYREMGKAYPKDPQIPLLLGATYFQQKRNADARAEFDKALQLAPDFLPALEQLVNLDLAEKQYPAARQRLEQSVKKHPKEHALQLLLGQVLIAQGDTNAAEAALTKAIELQPNSQRAYLMLAQLYTAAHQNAKALAQLKNALVQNPKDGSAMILMGTIYNSEHDYQNARDTYEKLLAVSPDNPVALNNLACVYANHLNQLDKAYSLARQARKAAPTDPAIADTLGWILFRQGQYAAALNLLQQSAAKLYSMPEVEFHLGMACYMNGKPNQAQAAFERALQLKRDFPEKAQCNQHLAVLAIDPRTAGASTRTWLENWTAKHPDDAIAWEKLGRLYQREGTTDKAISAYETVAKINPQDAAVLENLARLYIPKDLSKAITWAKAAYKQAPDDSGVTHLLGWLEFRAGDYKWALTLLELTAQAQPQNPSVFYDLAQAYYSLGRVEEARAAMQKAVGAGTSFANASQAQRFLKLTALADRPSQALAEQAEIAEILKSSPDYVPALMAQAAIAQQKSDFSAAEQACRKALKHYPDFAPAEKELAMLYARDPQKASEAYAMAVKARAALPNDPQVARTLGVLVYRRGDYTRAASLLQEAAGKLNRDAGLFYYLGMAQYQLKHRSDCKTALQRALELNLSGAEAARAKQTLTELK